MTDDEQDFFNKSIGKLEKEIIALKKEYQAECNRADELEDSLQTSWRNESKLKELLKECGRQLQEVELYRYDVDDIDQEDWFGISTKQAEIANKMKTKIDEVMK